MRLLLASMSLTLMTHRWSSIFMMVISFFKFSNNPSCSILDRSMIRNANDSFVSPAVQYRTRLNVPFANVPYTQYRPNFCVCAPRPSFSIASLTPAITRNVQTDPRLRRGYPSITSAFPVPPSFRGG